MTTKTSTLIPDAPVITTSSTTNIAGTEATPGTEVKVFNRTACTSIGTAIVTNGRWALTGKPAASAGDVIYAVAIQVLTDGNPGATSVPSASRTVGG